MGRPREARTLESWRSGRLVEKVPVTALPASNTNRYWLDYTVNSDPHSLMMRDFGGLGAAAVSSIYSDLLSLFSTDDIYGIGVTGMRFAVAGSDVTLPRTYSGTASFSGGTAFDTDRRAAQYSFTGRDDSGHKGRIFIFGAKFSANGDYRLQVAENARISDVVDYLNALPTSFCSINGKKMVWNAYANTGVNDHWVKKARG